jgi:ankyrin repeat protein
VSRKPPPHEHDGEEALVCLVKQLLALGANPNSRLDVSVFPLPSDFMAARATSALHLAATHGQRAAVEVLLDAGGLLELRCPLHTGRLGPTPLRAAMIPPANSSVTNNPRAHLETIITLLERGASFANTVPDDMEPKTDPVNWLVPLFENRTMVDTWYDAGLFDLFERIMELAAKQQGEGHVPDEWAADLVYVAITYGRSVAGFCKWYVPR